MSTILMQDPLDKNISSTGFFEDHTLSRKMTESFIGSQLVEGSEGKRR